MSRPIVHEVNISTGTDEYREMTDAEYAQHLIDIENIKLAQTAE